MVDYEYKQFVTCNKSGLV